MACATIVVVLAWSFWRAPVLTLDVSKTRNISAVHWPRTDVAGPWFDITTNGRVVALFPGGKVFDRSDVSQVSIARVGNEVEYVRFSLDDTDLADTCRIAKGLAVAWGLDTARLDQWCGEVSVPQGPNPLVTLPIATPGATIEVVDSYDPSRPYGIEFEVWLLQPHPYGK